MTRENKIALENIHQALIENLADFLDSDDVKLDERLGSLNDPKERCVSELHLRMAAAAMNEYKNTVL